jgi:hypothetical protein
MITKRLTPALSWFDLLGEMEDLITPSIDEDTRRKITPKLRRIFNSAVSINQISPQHVFI